MALNKFDWKSSKGGMKIQLKDSVLDTGQLTDKEADIHEAVNHLFKVCKQYGVTSFLRVILNGKRYVGMSSVPQGDEKKVQDDYDFLMGTISDFVDDVSGGRLAIMQLVNEDNPDPNLPETK